MPTITREKFKTMNDVFDNKTNRNLFELASKGYFEENTLSPIKIGKEANIFSAKKKDGTKIIIKIYRVNTCDFNRMFELLRRDPRFPKISKNKQKIVNAWASREFKNLHKARDGGVTVPTPYLIKENILLMEFIGDGEPAKQIKDEQPESKAFLDEIVQNMKKLHKANLVHGDLSQFNILTLHNHPIFIDFSQSMELTTQYAKEMLQRDIRNIANFFNKIGIKASEEEMMKKIIKSKSI